MKIAMNTEIKMNIVDLLEEIEKGLASGKTIPGEQIFQDIYAKINEKKNSFRFFPAAHKDLNGILEHMWHDDIIIAECLIEEIENMCQILTNSNAGNNMDNIYEGLLSSSVGSYKVFYNRTPNGIEIVRILKL